MTELESLKELRKLANERIQDWERPLFAQDEYKAIREIADEIQAEVDSRYMELPLDADGAPISVGDLISCGDSKPVKVTGVAQNAFHGPMVQTEDAIAGSWWAIADDTHHVKPRTVEDVLGEFASRVLNSGHQWGLDCNETIAKYAAELQMKGGE